MFLSVFVPFCFVLLHVFVHDLGPIFSGTCFVLFFRNNFQL